MKMSDRGIVALAMHEGVVPAPYKDSAGVWTFGIGHTRSAGLPDPAAMPKGNPADMEVALRSAFDVFRRDLVQFEEDVSEAVTVPLEQHEFDALVSFHFNTGGIARANLTRALNNGDRAGAANGFMGWLRPPEIRSRREAERRLFRDGTYPSGGVPVYHVTASAKPGAVVRSLSAADVLGYLTLPEAPAPATDALRAWYEAAPAGAIDWLRQMPS